MGRPHAAHNHQIGRVIRELHLPLCNLEYTVEQYLLSHGQRLDTETRLLLAGVRDCLSHLADCARDVARQPAGASEPDSALDIHNAA